MKNIPGHAFRMHPYKDIFLVFNISFDQSNMIKIIMCLECNYLKMPALVGNVAVATSTIFSSVIICMRYILRFKRLILLENYIMGNLLVI
jgi:hypothetical protein